jgi:hypothetical protein
MTDPNALTGCDPAVAIILARQIDAGRSDANEICGFVFCDYEALEIARQINSGRGSALDLEGLGMLPELAHAIAAAINAKELV